MMRRIPKQYGEYKTDYCPYCGKKALSKNVLKLNVCKDHVATKQDPSLRAIDGEYLDTKCGPHGNYCVSLRRGNISVKQVLEMNGVELEK